MKWPPASEELASGLTLAALVCLAIAVLGGSWTLTRPAIEQARHQLLLSRLDELLPPGSYDNDPVSDRIQVRADALGDTQPHNLYRLRHGRRNTAMVIEALAPDGYSGPIRLLIASSRHGQILGVRVTAHSETPGLGDAIDTGRSDWIRQFDRRTLDALPAPGTRLADVDQIDQITGATVTSQAVVAAVYRTLAWSQRHAEAVFSAPTGSCLGCREADK